MLKNFRLNILIRIIFMAILIAFLIYFILVEQHYLRSVYLFIFIVILIIEFVWYVDRTNRDFASFLMALLQGDFTTTFSESNKGKSFGELYRAFNLITKRFKKISTDKQAQHIYLETLVEHVKVGIISFDQNEKIHLMNNAIKQMLGKSTMLYLKSFSTISDELVETLRTIKPGNQKLIKVTVNNNLLQLSIHASAFKLQNDTYKLVSIQNIKNELESNELDAWKKLIRVLTHEIMNSVTPISSLTDTLGQIAQKENEKSSPTQEAMIKLQQGLDAIKTRSEGLQTFTEAYKSLTRIPQPSFVEANIYKLINGIETLLLEELKNIRFEIYTSDKDIKVIADPTLLEQVIINIIKNAIEAVADRKNPAISISIDKSEKVIIQITDNGQGIDEDKIDKVFIPFFTTKANGSGIGLALSREIIRQHNGTISVKSRKGEGTVFTITL